MTTIAKKKCDMRDFLISLVKKTHFFRGYHSNCNFALSALKSSVLDVDAIWYHAGDDDGLI